MRVEPNQLRQVDWNMKPAPRSKLQPGDKILIKEDVGFDGLGGIIAFLNQAGEIHWTTREWLEKHTKVI